MRILYVLMTVICLPFVLWGQAKAPKWMEKQKKAVLTVTTYKDNQRKHVGNAFFVSEQGVALSAYSLFKEADSATVTDINGKVFPVACILGADELYDVIRFQVEVSKKVDFLELASEPQAVGAKSYLLPYSEGKKVTKFAEGTVQEVSKLKDPYSYYKVSFPLEAGQANSPVLTEEGKVFGLAQEDASGKNENSYAVSAGYVDQLRVGSMDVLSSAYKAVEIKKAWPEDPAQAQITLFLLSGSQDTKSYLQTLDDFIRTFPELPDGYMGRASSYAYHRAELAPDAEGQARLLAQAMADMTEAEKCYPEKSDYWFNRAKLIYGVASADTTLNDPAWTVENALADLDRAIAIKDLPLFRQLRGDIYFGEGQYDKAFTEYMTVNQSESASSQTWYFAAKSLMNVHGAQISDMIQLLDSAVAKCGNPPSAEAATYVLERVDLRMQLGQYKEAVADYDLYYSIMGGKVNASFYYYREQAKFRVEDFDGALADIQTAIGMDSSDPNYYAEEASIWMRKSDYEKALASVEKALKLAPDFASCYRLKGLCLVRQKRMDEACAAFSKAQELGDPLAARLIKTHCSGR